MIGLCDMSCDVCEVYDYLFKRFASVVLGATGSFKLNLESSSDRTPKRRKFKLLNLHFIRTAKNKKRKVHETS